MVNPDGIADDFWRETMTVIARPSLFMGPVFQFTAQVDNASPSHMGLRLIDVANWFKRLDPAARRRR